MPEADMEQLRTEFQFGTTVVRIVQGDITDPPIDGEVEAVVSTDDNYLTMGSGVAGLLREKADSEYYIRAAQVHCPMEAGTVVATGAYGLKNHIPGIKHVLHGAVIDYDTDRFSLSQLVSRATTHALETAQALRLKSVLFPAFATGAGELLMEACARQMSHAIKQYVAEECPLKEILIILFRPDPEDESIDAAEIEYHEERNRRFIREANLILDVPYDPTSVARECRDFYGRERELESLTRIITGEMDEGDNKHHAMILGGPTIGKDALLNQIYCQSRIPGNPLSKGRVIARVTFGRVHRDTPTSFIYRKFLYALSEVAEDERLRARVEAASKNPDIDCQHFLALFEEPEYRDLEVVFLIDQLPKLLRMEPGESKGPWNFWADLDRLQDHVRFVSTARHEEYEALLQNRLQPFTKDFHRRIKTITLSCLKEAGCRDWIDALFRRYLHRPKGAPAGVHRFVGQEAGRHPYLISLLGHTLIREIKEEMLVRPPEDEILEPTLLDRLFQTTAKKVERSRSLFFETLITDPALDDLRRQNLKNLAKAVMDEKRSQQLLAGVEAAESDAIEQFQALLRKDNPRNLLDAAVLRHLETQGYLVDAGTRETVDLLAPAFAKWLYRYFGLGDQQVGVPQDVMIGLLNPEPSVMTTLFGERGARLLSAHRRLAANLRDEFMASFRECIRHMLHPIRYPSSGQFRDLEDVASFILTYFTTDAIKRYLQNPPPDATILLAVDEALKDVPWELVLETTYGGDIPYPFVVGRSIISSNPAQNIGPTVRGEKTVRALLIGNPTDDLKDAEAEIDWLRTRLIDDGRFVIDDEDVLVGSDRCRSISVLRTLSSGRYGLIHYSGHTQFDGVQSAWHLKDGRITTDLLTSALQNAPPALVFSSSCESGVGAALQPREYENQTFDLPSAFLQAGVQTYIGTLWEVSAQTAYEFVKAFYSAFLTDEPLGRCLQAAKISIKGSTYRMDRLAFILYGDPHTRPGEVFPALAGDVRNNTRAGGERES